MMMPMRTPDDTHRSTPAPAVRMSWVDLLFLHWPVPVDAVRRTLPPGLEPDTFDGHAWVGLVPFTMTGCHFAGFGWVPRLRHFHECNVRTYARCGDTAGVWFLSLDAANLFPVLGGRLMWDLPYVYSRFDVGQHDGEHRYALRRRPGPWAGASTRLTWRSGDPLPASTPGSLAHFLTERYRLFAHRRGRLWVGRIHHDPWPLREAEASVGADSLVRAAGFGDVAAGPAIAMAADRVDVVAEPMERVDPAARDPRP